MPATFSNELQSLIKQLLVRDPTQRLGFKGADEIKNHEFFKGVDWEEVEAIGTKPPILPNFMWIPRKETIAETPVENPEILEDPRNIIKGFSCVREIEKF